MLLLDELSFGIHARNVGQPAPGQLNCLLQRLVVPADHRDQDVIGDVPDSIHDLDVTVVTKGLTGSFLGHYAQHGAALACTTSQSIGDFLYRCERPLATRFRKQPNYRKSATRMHDSRCWQCHLKNAYRPIGASSLHVNGRNYTVLDNKEHLSVTLVRSLHALAAFFSPSGAYHRTSSEIRCD